MTDDEIRAVLDRYESVLRPNLVAASKSAEHLTTMLPKMRAMIDDYQEVRRYLVAAYEAIECGRDFDRIALVEGDAKYAHAREKLMRWLGFMQGVLWSLGIYTIDELRLHNMGPRATDKDNT